MKVYYSREKSPEERAKNGSWGDKDSCDRAARQAKGISDANPEGGEIKGRPFVRE